MIAVVNVICPQCARQFLVPEGAPETLCPGCDELIVWRECLRTKQVFPVLARWATWEHPGCSAVHAVDLSRPEAADAPVASPEPTDEPAPQRPADVAAQPGTPAAPRSLPAHAGPAAGGGAVAERAMWLDENVRGALVIDAQCVSIVPAGGAPVVVTSRDRITSVEITSSEDLTPAEGTGWRPFRRAEHRAPRGARLVLEFADGSATIDALVDVEVLRGLLADPAAI